jgi:endothelin-converting enzyme/putative endopeptidase
MWLGTVVDRNIPAKYFFFEVPMRIRILFFLILTTALLSAQQMSTPSATVAGSTLKSVELGDMNRAIDPCTDFFEYANGNWRAQNPIPASMTRWSRRWRSGETIKEDIKVILDEAAQNKSAAKGSTAQLIGDYYGSCTDETRVNAAGLKPLVPWFNQIDSAKDVAALQHVMVRLHDIGVTVPFAFGGSQDPHEPTMIMADIGASGLSLPEREYYLGSEDRFKEARAKFLEHVTNMSKLAGADDAAASAAAKAVLDMETHLAEASLAPAALRDPKATDHKTSFAQLQAMAPHMRWSDYFEHLHLDKTVTLNVQEPKFLAEVDRQMQSIPLADWKFYLTWQLLSAAAPYLSSNFVDEDFAFNGKFLNGATELKPRWKRCAESTDELFGEALGKEYVDRHFPPEAKARMQELIQNVLAAMHDDILTLSWMGEETKKRALAKLATFNVKVGYPDKWKDYSHVAVGRDNFWEDVLAGRRFNVEDNRSTIGKPVDRGRWGMTPPTSNAYYTPLLNEIVFPAGILVPPAFDVKAPDALNYGAIGVVIGHEISHGFDDEGSQYDELGALKNWWTDDDLKKFKDRGACVANQFDGYFIEPGVHHNGKLVLGESIGDLGGAKLAFKAFQKSLEGKPRPANVDGFTPEQQFFIAWGQWRGDAVRIETQRVMVQSDPHPIGKYRVNGPLSNLPEFQQAFSCKAGSTMVRAENRCEVW